MKLRNISNTNLFVSPITLGTWAFGGDKWWGKQEDKDSMEVLETAFASGINTIDTAPVYGRGRSETIIGSFLKKKRIRDDTLIATKLGLSHNGPKIIHNLNKKRMIEEIDESRKRLQTDYFDIYQVHWPDPETPIAETASVMYNFFKKGIIRAIGVSNYSVAQMKEFMKHCPLHTLQPPYNMFRREIESDTIPFCKKNQISILGYIPLHSGILTGKFFFQNTKIPGDLCRKNHRDLKEPFYSINKDCLEKIKNIALKYKKTLPQFVINWTKNREGILSILVGARNKQQLKENIQGAGFFIDENDRKEIENILEIRDKRVKQHQK